MSRLKEVSKHSAASISAYLNREARMGGVSVQQRHDGVGVHVSPYGDAPSVMLALQRKGYMYTVKSHQNGTSLIITHRKM